MINNTNNRKNKGFTLAELLIVVAVIAVLVAVSIPIFIHQLEKSKEAADLANVRGAYAEVISAALLEDKDAKFYQNDSWTIVVDLKQAHDGWTTKTPLSIGAITSGQEGGTNTDETWIGLPEGGGTCTVTCTQSGKVSLIWGNNSVSGDDPGAGQEPDSPQEEPNAIETIKSIAAEYPTGNFTGIAGNIYSYNGGYYICNTTQEYAAGGSPENWYQWQFINMSDDAVTLTDADLTNPWGNNEYVYPHIERGTLYTDGTDYYIRNQTSDNAKTPKDESWNWTKINK